MSGLDKLNLADDVVRIMANEFCGGCGSRMIRTGDGNVCFSCMPGTDGEAAWDAYRKEAEQGVDVHGPVSNAGAAPASAADAREPVPVKAGYSPEPPPLLHISAITEGEEQFQRWLKENPDKQPNVGLTGNPPPEIRKEIIRERIREHDGAGNAGTAAEPDAGSPLTAPLPGERESVTTPTEADLIWELATLVPKVREKLLDAYQDMSRIGIIAEELKLVRK